MGFRKAVVLALLLVSPVASAAPSAAEKDAARKLMDEGKARLKANDPAHAVEAYQKAHDIMHVPTTGLALAKAHLAAGHLVEAHNVAVDTARMPKEAGEPAVFEQARKHARELDAQVKPRIPTLHVKAHGGVIARITVDDSEAPLALIGEPMPIDPGKHLVVVKPAEGIEVASEIEVSEREAKELDVAIATPPPAPPPPEPPKKKSVVLAPTDGERDHVTTPSNERTTLADVMIYGGFGLGAVGLAAGAITGGLAISKGSDVTPLCQNDICAPSAASDLDTAKSFATVSNITLAIGAAGVVIGVVGLLLPRQHHR